MDVKTLVETKARAARAASRALALCSTRTKNEALTQMARGLEEKTGAILDANRADLERARAAGVPRAFLDRLTLTDARIETMAFGTAGDRRAARPGGRDRGRHAPAVGSGDQPRAGAAGGDRLHLRIAPQRDGGRRRAVREVGQRRRAARRQRGHRVQRAHRRGAGQGPGEDRRPLRRHPVRGDHRPGGGGARCSSRTV